MSEYRSIYYDKNAEMQKIWTRKMKTFVKMEFCRYLFELVLFYFIYYALIVGLSVFMFWLGTVMVLYRDIPTLTGTQSILKLQPGLSVLPRPDSLTSLTKYRVGRYYTVRGYLHDLLSFTQHYERHGEKSRLVDCTKTTAYLDHPRFSCKFPIDIGAVGCNINKFYGYDETSPCFLVRLNRIFGWVPQLNTGLRNESQDSGYPSIKIKCEGISDADKANIGNICYYDMETMRNMEPNTRADQVSPCHHDYGRIRHYFFPYKKQINYQTPYVWVKLFNIKRNIIIMVQCWAIADNIIVDLDNGDGSVKFEVIVD